MYMYIVAIFLDGIRESPPSMKWTALMSSIVLCYGSCPSYTGRISRRSISHRAFDPSDDPFIAVKELEAYMSGMKLLQLRLREESPLYVSSVVAERQMVSPDAYQVGLGSD